MSVELQCDCGEVCLSLTDARAANVNRVICYCRDCQAYAHALERADLLDGAGGTDLVQIAAGTLRIEQGAERVRGMRLTANGAFRWYAACCNSPIANMASITAVGLGLFVSVFQLPPASIDKLVGKPMGGIHGEQAAGTAPAGTSGITARIMARSVPKVMKWKVQGKMQPNPFLAGEPPQPAFPVTVLVLIPPA